MTKKEKILEAAIEEFAEKGLQGANTNRIVEKAGASKGLLFHYYGDKDQLFLLCAHIVLDKFTADLLHSINESDSDIFMIARNLIKTKIEWLYQNVLYGKLLSNIAIAFLTTDKKEYKVLIESYSKQIYDEIFEHCDKSKFRKDIPFETIRTFLVEIMDAMSTKIELIEGATWEQILALNQSIVIRLDSLLELVQNGVYNKSV